MQPGQPSLHHDPSARSALSVNLARAPWALARTLASALGTPACACACEHVPPSRPHLLADGATPRTVEPRDV
eukprot:6855061-Alexandrium_andersonii.AAC.1